MNHAMSCFEIAEIQEENAKLRASANTFQADSETIEDLEARIRTLYAALIRAELKAHAMRNQAKLPKSESVQDYPDWSSA